MLTDFQNFFTDRFISKYATKSTLTIPPHVTCVVELPCETSVSLSFLFFFSFYLLLVFITPVNKDYQNSENLMHASLSITNHKVVTCLRCGGLFSNHFTVDLLLSLLVKKFFKICEHLAKLQARSD